MSSLALRYLLDFSTTQTIVLGGKSIADYQEAIRVFELPSLSEPTHNALAKVREQLQQPSLQRQVANKLKQLLLRNHPIATKS
jgi:predicted aldo/keto reductase-like oxidoreductase